jgi:hypothetical protein
MAEVLSALTERMVRQFHGSQSSHFIPRAVELERRGHCPLLFFLKGQDGDAHRRCEVGPGSHRLSAHHAQLGGMGGGGGLGEEAGLEGPTDFRRWEL